MLKDVTQYQLLSYLRGLDDTLFAKVLETRSAVATLLTRVPNTFSNYTDHSIAHSDEIIRQLSNLLFGDEGSTLVIKLSAAEAYVLSIAAILHDSGMVVTEEEKIAVLESDDWAVFVSQDKVKQLWHTLNDAAPVGTTPHAEHYKETYKFDTLSVSTFADAMPLGPSM